MDSSKKAELTALIQDTPVIMFSKSYCPFCDDAKAILQRGDIEFKALELDNIKGGDAI